MRPVVFVLLLLTASGCGRPPGDQGLADRIAERVEPGAVIDLAALAPFDWTTLYIFSPYTTETFAEQETEIRWPAWWAWSKVELLEDRVFLVFLDETEVVAAFDYFRRDGDFVGLNDDSYPEAISPATARFYVPDRGRGPLVLVPEAEAPVSSGDE